MQSGYYIQLLNLSVFRVILRFPEEILVALVLEYFGSFLLKFWHEKSVLMLTSTFVPIAKDKWVCKPNTYLLVINPPDLHPTHVG